MQDLFLFDRSEELIGIVGADEQFYQEQEQELNKFVQMEAGMTYREEIENAFYIGHKDIDDEQLFHMYRISGLEAEGKEIHVSGIHTFFDDMKVDGYIKERRLTDASVHDALEIILGGSRWQIGRINSARRGSVHFYYLNRISAFWKFLELWGVEFQLRMTFLNGKVTGRYVDVSDRVGEDYGKRFEAGDNLIHVLAEEDRSEIYTALVGRGRGEEIIGEDGEATGGFGRRILFTDVEWKKSEGKPVDKPKGQEYVEIPEATAEYGIDGRPRIGIVELEDVEDPEELLQATYEMALVASRKKRQFRAEAIHTGIMVLGETVGIIDEEIGVKYKTRVFRLRRDFLNPLRRTFDFGEKLTVSREERANQIENAVKEQEEVTRSWIEGVLEAQKNAFFNNDGYNYELKAGNAYGLPGGYYSFNKPIDENPEKMIYLGGGMLAISNKKDPQGNWIMQTFGTGDGFSADVMNAGSLNVGNVRVKAGDRDIIWVDGETGEVKMNLNKLTIDFTDVATKDDLEGIEAGEGKSAYEIAVEKGFVGTEEQWLASLKGQPGEKGEPGRPGEKGEPGQQGIPGTPGKDGKQFYTWIKYADTPTSGMSDNPAGKKYLGIAVNKETSVESYNYSDYVWSEIKGEQGVAGKPGENGQTTYTWVKYADDASGNGMSDSPTGKRFIGLAFNKTTPTKSTNKADYAWSPLYDNVKVGGVNLIVRHDELPKTYIDNVGNVVAASNSATMSRMVEVEPGEVLTFSKTSTGVDDFWRWKWMTENGTYIARAAKSENLFQWTVPANAYRLQVSYPDTAQVQVERGNVATGYRESPEDTANVIGNKSDQENVDEIIDRVGAILEDLESKVDAPTYEEQQKAYNDWLSRVETDAEYAKDLANRVDEATVTLPIILGENAQRWQSLEGFVQVDGATNTVSVGSQDGNTKVIITQDSMGFYNGGERVAVITNQYLQIDRGIFTSSVQIGKHKLAPMESEPNMLILSFVE